MSLILYEFVTIVQFLQKIDSSNLEENNSRRYSTAICGLTLSSRRSTNSTTATLSSLTPPSSQVQETSSDDENHTSASNDMCPKKDSKPDPDANHTNETYRNNWKNLWFNEEVQI